MNIGKPKSTKTEAQKKQEENLAQIQKETKVKEKDEKIGEWVLWGGVALILVVLGGFILMNI